MEAAIPAFEAEGPRAPVTITREVWESLLPVIERDHPGARIVGWYHAHPGGPISLSEYDKFLHRNFFPNPAMPALVADPVTGSSAWFGWRGEDVVLLEEPTRRDGAPVAALAGTDPPARRGRRARLLAAGTLSLASLSAGWFLGATLGTDAGAAPEADLTGLGAEVTRLEAELAGAQSDLAEALAAADDATRPVSSAEEDEAAGEVRQGEGPQRAAIAFTLRYGDTLWGLAESFYGGGEHYPEIADANPGSSPTTSRRARTSTLSCRMRRTPARAIRPPDRGQSGHAGGSARSRSDA